MKTTPIFALLALGFAKNAITELMNHDLVFRLLLLACYVIGWGLKWNILRKASFGKRIKSVNEGREMLMFRTGTFLFMLPIFYSLTSWFDFANLGLPLWLRWTGAGISVVATFIMLLSHQTLGANWSGQLNIQEAHTLVVKGIYARIRHPMYLAFLLSGIGTLLLSANWFIGVPLIVWFWVMYLGRIKYEEQMMVDEFGGQYIAYMQSTGRLLPKIKANSAFIKHN